MATNETNGDGRAANPSGVYRHPDTGEELVTQATSKLGNPQADAIVRLGFVYVGPAKLKEANADGEKAELVEQVDPGAGPVANTSPTLKSVGQLQAELETAKLREEAASKASQAKSELVDSSSSSNEVKSPAKSESSSSSSSTSSKGNK